MYWSASGEGSFKTRQSKIEKYVPSFNTHRGSKQSKGTDNVRGHQVFATTGWNLISASVVISVLANGQLASNTNLHTREWNLKSASMVTSLLNSGQLVSNANLHTNAELLGNASIVKSVLLNGQLASNTNLRLSLIHIWRCRRRG